MKTLVVFEPCPISKTVELLIHTGNEGQYASRIFLTHEQKLALVLALVNDDKIELKQK